MWWIYPRVFGFPRGRPRGKKTPGYPVDLRLTLGYRQICSKLKKCATPGKLAKIPGGTPGYMALKSTKTTSSDRDFFKVYKIKSIFSVHAYAYFLACVIKEKKNFVSPASGLFCIASHSQVPAAKSGQRVHNTVIPMLWIRITLMRNRIRLFTLMRIRILASQ